MVRDEMGSRDFDEWYQLEWPRLVATFTLASGERELGREIAAEALTRALERWDRVGGMASPGGWTYRVGINLLRRHHRRLSMERRASARLAAASVTTVLPDDSVELWCAVAALPTRERTAVALRYGAGLTEPEIAAVLRIATGTVSATLNHARTHLRTALSEPIEEMPSG
jgi:RNA polymerase sigma factor (sigma-70 family)